MPIKPLRSSPVSIPVSEPEEIVSETSLTPLGPVDVVVTGFSRTATAPLGDNGVTIRGKWSADQRSIETSGSFRLSKLEPAIALSDIAKIEIPMPWNRGSVRVTKEGSGLRVELSQINTVAWEKHDARLHVTLKNGERVLVTTKTNVLRLDKSALHLDGAERSLSVRQRELAQVHERIANAEAALAAPVTATQWQIESAAELEKAKAAVPAAITNARDAWNSADFVNRMLAYSSYEPTASEGNELRALSRRLRALDEKIEIQTLLERPAPALNAERADLVAKMEASEAAIKAKLAPNEVDFLASREVYFGRVNSSDAPESLRTRLNEVRLAESLVAIADGEANRERAHLVASYTNVTSNGPSAIAQAEAAVVAAQKVVEDAKQTPKIEVVTVSPQT